MNSILMASLPSLVCMLAGSGLIIVEVFLPGFGLPGISGIALCVLGIALIGMKFGLLTAACVLLVLVALLALLVSWILRAASKDSSKSPLFLHETEALGQKEDMQALVGRQGKTLCVLRPSGLGDFDGVRLNIVTEGGFIEKDRTVAIVQADGSRIVVREIKE